MCCFRSIAGFLFVAALPLLASAAQPGGFWDGRFFLPGVNGPVHAIAVNGQDLYLGGEFTSAGAVAVANIARWDGTNWAPLGLGVNGAVNALAVRGNEVFVGATFTQAGAGSASLVARWDGAAWNALGGGLRGARVNALAVDAAGALYAAGEFTNAGTVAVANIARWDGTNWSALGTGLSNDPYCCLGAGAGRARHEPVRGRILHRRRRGERELHRQMERQRMVGPGSGRG